MRISMSAMYFTVDVLCVSSATYESTSGLQLLLFVLAPPTAAKRRYVGTPHTPAKGFALCTPLRPRSVALCRVSQTFCPLHSLLIRYLMELQAFWPGAIRLTYLVQVCVN